jgi:predicted porin
MGMRGKAAKAWACMHQARTNKLKEKHMTKLNKAVAFAVLAMGASAANAGIVIPAGDWTVDINGNVNAFYIHENGSDSNTVVGGFASTKTVNATNGGSTSSVNTGLLPSWLGITGKKRENDLDISWTISFQPGASASHALSGGSGSEFRQANLTFGDKSWGTIKLGKDLGLFGSDAILNDQTLLGVGATGSGLGLGLGSGSTTTLGRIGTGFLYADFTGQVEYSSPNWNGFQFNVEIAQPWQTNNLGGAMSGSSSGNQKEPAFEGNVNYSWAGDFSGKVWLEGFSQKVDGVVAAGKHERADVFGIGGKVGFSGAELVGYYYDGSGVGTTGLLMDGFSAAGNKRDSSGGYIQGSYKIPGVGTKLAASWGESNLKSADATDAGLIATLVKKNEMWTIGAYHPLTSNLNLVAEYSNVKSKNQAGQENQSDTVDLGAILFF